ncbi:ornithine carbamoyltransferase [Paenibacillus lautus]|jgi:ornithine carbamoyltransferase|uniref:Ornithine carbamoyltransferase n=1 Tax=Paenibacillus lautus TaxID=1401 RepID=A0A385TBH2_PAELA|nr:MULTISPECIES: ornithine carbamoyltransferase [Paenibacillus]MBY0163260.1 ornithine carbamoyltransferase [Cytobacillus firmus]ACX68054.1 ornithine carbamoyltransferase [Paenibacillus sp. Y412MC10]AYB41890.1 ornithine carbamoyltransferase [Paenibacillus lautus]EGG33925.1 ornithine carbamoyltransferase [Paenibacillus sp. HGF5]ETT67805.1 ornithine carbamoyltransferase [Paenibacillus sp. FSL H8-457]
MAASGQLKELSLKGRDMIELDEYSTEEIQFLLDSAIEIKRKQKNGEVYQPLKGKTIGLIFEKSSTRTRVSFEAGMFQLGGHALFLSKNDIQLGRGEPISDTAQVMSRYLDGLMIRTFGHDNVVNLAKYASIPVINGLSDMAHPCQVLADLQTVLEHKGKLKGLKMAFIGDGNNMAHSLLIGGAKMGMHVAVASPKGYEADASIVKLSEEIAAQTGGKITITQDPLEAAKDADVIYTDVWASMGFEEEQAQREAAFADYQVNEELVKAAKPDYLFLHCLPAHRGEEVSEGVIDGANSVIFDQAENRLHAQKALMVALMA